MTSIPVCNHEHTQVRRRQYPSGDAYYEQCLRCGHMGRRLKRAEITEQVVRPSPDWDDALDEKWYADIRAIQQAELDDERKQKKAEFDQWYEGYLATPQWRDRRLKVLRRDDYLCQACLVNRATAVHHTTYAHVGA